ncbi:MAG: hypothetical protein LUG18_11100 [Candidatus Azobacteroides sp.]|nr:hypothetical protein [Candidatus Azobacteroides sp.]
MSRTSLKKAGNKIKEFVKADLNFLFYRSYRQTRKAKRHLFPFYHSSDPVATNKEKMIIAMMDGKIYHGGLADRLRGIITTYHYCKEHQVDFRIHHTNPFNLKDILIPNHYNWEINPEDISYNSSDSYPVYIDSSVYYEKDMNFQKRVARKKLGKNYKQIHIYTNMYYSDHLFGTLFNELFKPGPALQTLLDENLKKTGKEYISLSFRFQGLLDENFLEGRALESEEKKEELINKCLEKIKEIRLQYSDIPTFLVTADSERFIRAVKKLDFVYIIPGKIGHMDNKEEKDVSVHLKTFVDFFMLANSQKIMLLVTGNMYRSGFAKRAAKLYDTPFEEIIF